MFSLALFLPVFRSFFCLNNVERRDRCLKRLIRKKKKKKELTLIMFFFLKLIMACLLFIFLRRQSSQPTIDVFHLERRKKKLFLDSKFNWPEEWGNTANPQWLFPKTISPSSTSSDELCQLSEACMQWTNPSTVAHLNSHWLIHWTNENESSATCCFFTTISTSSSCVYMTGDVERKKNSWCIWTRNDWSTFTTSFLFLQERNALNQFSWTLSKELK